MNTKPRDRLHRNSVFAWIAVATGLLLLVPLIAMQFSEEVNWDGTDFLVMGMLLFAMGSVFVLLSRRAPRRNRLAIGFACAAVFLYVWAELAVGIFTNLGS
jgi:O-antigen/teichoic acid export membrane protein